MTALDVAVTGRTGALAPWWLDKAAGLEAEAVALLGEMGLADVVHRPFAVLSEGERQRVLLVRMRMAAAELLVFDEPAAGLDLGARERLVSSLRALAVDGEAPPIVFVTHHVEEIPSRFTHVLVLREGEILAAGPIETTLDEGCLSRCFGLDLTLERSRGRWAARAAVGSRSA